MKWNGIVSHACHHSIAATFAIEKATHAASTHLCRSQPVTRMTHGLDRGVRPQLLSEAADADVDDVGARVELIAPDLREQPLAAEDLARVARELEDQPELALREVGDE